MCQKEKAKRSRKCIEKKSRNISKEKEQRQQGRGVAVLVIV